MKDDKLIQQLLDHYNKAHGCALGKEKLLQKADSRDELIAFFLDHYHFACGDDTQKKFLTKDFIKANFTPEELYKHHIYIDEQGVVKAHENGVYMFMGGCKISLRTPGASAVRLVLCDDAQVAANNHTFAYMNIDVYDSSTISIANSSTRTVYINKHSPDVTVNLLSGSSKIIVREHRQPKSPQ